MITFKTTDEFIESLNLTNKDDFNITLIGDYGIRLLSANKLGTVQFNIPITYTQNDNGELEFDKTELNHFKAQLNQVKRAFEWEALITDDMQVRKIWPIGANYIEIGFVTWRSDEFRQAGIIFDGNKITVEFGGQISFENDRDEAIEWNFNGENHEINAEGLSNKDLLDKVMTITSGEAKKIDTNIALLEQVMNRD